MCTHISLTDIKNANKHGQVLSQPDKARQVKELDFRASTAHLKTRELLNSSQKIGHGEESENKCLVRDTPFITIAPKKSPTWGKHSKVQNDEQF